MNNPGRQVGHGIEELSARYPVCQRAVSVGALSFTLLAPTGIDALLERCRDAEDLPFWSEIWPAAEGLGEFLQGIPDLQGKTVLELGCGLGLVGLVAATIGAKVTLSDYITDAVHFAQFNASNHVLAVEACVADWRSWPLSRHFDLVVGADILYEPTLHQALLEVLQGSVAAWGRVYLADPGRGGAEGFLRLAEEKGWRFLALDEVLVTRNNQPIVVNILTLAPPQLDITGDKF